MGGICTNTCTINYDTISGFNTIFPRQETDLTNNTIDFTSNGVCEETRDVVIYSDAGSSVLFNCPLGTDATDCDC